MQAAVAIHAGSVKRCQRAKWAPLRLFGCVVALVHRNCQFSRGYDPLPRVHHDAFFLSSSVGSGLPPEPRLDAGKGSFLFVDSGFKSMPREFSLIVYRKRSAPIPAVRDSEADRK
jgi:hypothetical protein